MNVLIADLLEKSLAMKNIAKISGKFNISVYRLENLRMLTRQRLELLDAIEQTPEEYIPDLLNFVHFFHQQRITKSSRKR